MNRLPPLPLCLCPCLWLRRSGSGSGSGSGSAAACLFFAASFPVDSSSSTPQGGGIRFSSFVRVMRVGVGPTEDAERWSRQADMDPYQERQTLIDLMLLRGITSKDGRDTAMGVVGGASGRRLLAARAELELIEDIDDLRARAVEDELDIPDDELRSEPRYVWLVRDHSGSQQFAAPAVSAVSAVSAVPGCLPGDCLLAGHSCAWLAACLPSVAALLLRGLF